MKICPTCKAQYEGGEMFCPVDASRLVTPSQLPPPTTDGSDPLVGAVVSGRYRIVRRIGEGGMGIVYEAVHVVIEKRVALKVLRADFTNRQEVVERFRQEAKSASRIGHEHIVDISDFGETPAGQSYFVMEFLEGEDLANLLAREGTVAPQRAIHIVMQCCRALGAAHAKGIVHRDMKPENVFLTRREGSDSFVKIVDFGIAKMSDLETPGAPGRKLTKTGMIFGTPEYMSPEQAAGKPLDHRVDVYALGVILYEMICGRVPFVGDSFMGILTQHMFDTPPKLAQINPHVRCRPELEAVIYRALAKDPDKRFRTMDEFAESLKTIETGGDRTFPGYGEPVKARWSRSQTLPQDDMPRASAIPGLPQRRRAVWIRAFLGILLCASGVGAWWLFSPRPTRERTSRLTDTSGKKPGPPPPAASVPPSVDTPSAPPDAGVAPNLNVTLTVNTDPAGAELSAEGRGILCETTPCTVDAVRGQTLRLVARKGRSTGTVEVTPTSPDTLEMKLTSRKPSKTKGTSGGDGAEGSPHIGDLKVPDIFREGR